MDLTGFACGEDPFTGVFAFLADGLIATRWHLVQDVPASAGVVSLLEALDDPRRAWLG